MEPEKRSVINLSASKKNAPGSQTERKLSNQDFRVLLMTPRSTRAHAPTGAPSSTPSSKLKYKKSYVPKSKPKNPALKLLDESKEEGIKTDNKYRDRAKERREGITQDALEIQKLTLPSNQDMNLISKVAIGDTLETAEEVDKSKYLTVDIEKVPIVKGLDYALLKKVKLENTQIQLEEIAKSVEVNVKPAVVDSTELKFNSLLARNIYNKIFENRLSVNCDLFFPGRMAYIFCLEEDNPDSIIPTTLVRSKMEISPLEKRNSISASDIVIKKLTHVLSYLRHGKSTKKVDDKTVDTSAANTTPITKPKTDINIYDDVGIYDPNEALTKYTLEKSQKIKQGSYFDQNNKEELELKNKQNSTNPESMASLLTSTDQEMVQTMATQAREKKLKMLNAVPESYAECYPEAQEMIDAIVDSEDEVDFTKMDPGKKKSNVNRWDFDNDEDYGRYMDNKEAMPKAAYQFGVKTKDGRKTRRQQQEKAKAKLDREFDQISQIMSKRSSKHEFNDNLIGGKKKKM